MAIAVLSVVLLLATSFVYAKPIPGSTSERVTVFIIDSYADPNFVSGRITDFPDQGPVSHGSLVARTVKEYFRKCSIISLVAEDRKGNILHDAYLHSLKTVVDYQRKNPNKTAILNISLGRYEPDITEHNLIKQLRSYGGITVAAAGNGATDDPFFPAAYPEVTAVAALKENKKTTFSNYGPHIDIAASGNVEFMNIESLPYQTLSRQIRAGGTSFAAPKVSALLAEVMYAAPELSSGEALATIISTADALENDPFFFRGFMGAGRINKFRTLWQTEPGYVIKKLLLPAAVIFLLVLSTTALYLKLGWLGTAVSFFLWIAVIPVLIMYSYSFYVAVHFIMGIASSAGFHSREIMILLLGTAASIFLSRERLRYFWAAFAFGLLFLAAGSVFIKPMALSVIFSVIIVSVSGFLKQLDSLRIDRIRETGEESVHELKNTYSTNMSVGKRVNLIRLFRFLPFESSCSALISLWKDELNTVQNIHDTGNWGRLINKYEFKRIQSEIITSLSSICSENCMLLAPFAGDDGPKQTDIRDHITQIIKQNANEHEIDTILGTEEHSDEDITDNQEETYERT